MRRTISLLAGLLAIISLGGNAAAKSAELAGIWHSIGYGLWLDIQADEAHIYQASAITCLPMLDIPHILYNGQTATLQDASIAGLGKYIGTNDYQLSLNDGLLSLEVGKLNPIQAERAASLPDVCHNLTANTPTTNFETLWHMFAEHYAFFDLHGVDWQAAYDHYRPLINDQMSETDLFAVFRDMLTPLNDSHVSINSLFDSFSPTQYPAWFKEVDTADFGTYAMIPADHYLLGEPQFAANDQIIYGQLSESVGYMNILAFDEFSKDGDNIAVLKSAMAQILDAFAGLQAIVMDVRFNPGGDDSNGLFIAGHFTDQRQLVFSKSVWFEQAFHPLLDVYVEPTTDHPFTGKVYLLTSGLSVSAAETFALAMRTLPNVTLVGEHSNGAFSDMWFVTLPNGWIATLSNERYLSSDGVLYEGVGVPPDVEWTMSAAALKAGQDPMLEAALALPR